MANIQAGSNDKHYYIYDALGRRIAALQIIDNDPAYPVLSVDETVDDKGNPSNHKIAADWLREASKDLDDSVLGWLNNLVNGDDSTLQREIDWDELRWFLMPVVERIAMMELGAKENSMHSSYVCSGDYVLRKAIWENLRRMSPESFKNQGILKKSTMERLMGWCGNISRRGCGWIGFRQGRFVPSSSV